MWHPLQAATFAQCPLRLRLPHAIFIGSLHLFFWHLVTSLLMIPGQFWHAACQEPLLWQLITMIARQLLLHLTAELRLHLAMHTFSLKGIGTCQLFYTRVCR